MQKPSFTREIRELQDIISRIEHFESAIGHYQEQCNATFEAMQKECTSIVTDAKEQLHQILVSAEEQGIEPIPDVPIDDKKLKKAWIALFRHHNGATAEMIAEDLGRHRTTVSTYLNYLVVLRFAEKERRGHEIYYTAVKNMEGGISE
jgi:response regulator of citrate/malate metabolism